MFGRRGEAPQLNPEGQKSLEKKPSVPPPIPEEAKVASFKKAQKLREVKSAAEDAAALEDIRGKLENIQVEDVGDKFDEQTKNWTNPWEDESGKAA